MDNYEDGEYYEEEGEVEEEHEGQALGYDDEEGEEAHHGESPFQKEPPEPEEEPLPPKKEWEGFVKLHLPSTLPTAEQPRPPLVPSRVYFAKNEVPEWTRFLVTDDVPYFEAVLKGKDVADDDEESLAGDGEAEEEEHEEGDEEEQDGDGDGDLGGGDEQGDDEYNDEDEYNEGTRKKGSKRSSNKSSRMSHRNGQQEGFEDGGAGLPVEFDEDGFLVIPEPFRGGVRFSLVQLLHSQAKDSEAGLPAINVDDDSDELVFVARMIPKEEADADDQAFAEASGIADPEDVPAVGPLKPLNLRSRIMVIPAANDEADEDEGGAEFADEHEGEHDGEVGSSRVASRFGHDEGADHDGDVGESSKPHKAGDEDLDKTSPLEFRIDALTLAALFCHEGFKKALMRREMPSTHFLEGWLEAFSVPAAGTTDESTAELTTMVGNICTATNAAIELKKNPTPHQEPTYDEDGNEVPPTFDAKHPPPPPAFVTLNEQGMVSVPKLKMDLRWTFSLEKELPNLTSAMRHLRNRLLESARIVPAHPSVSDTMTTPSLLLSYLEMLMVVPRSALTSWTRPKPEEEEDDVEDLEAILIPSDDEQRLTPLSHMLGRILLDLRTREAKRKNKKKELRLSALAAHKPLLCKRFLERGTIYDPLLVPHYALRAEGAPDANPYNATLNKTSPSPNSPLTASSPSPIADSAWPASLRLYDSDLVALACARYGALDTFRELLRLKNALPRLYDDTVGTYHLLFHSFDHLDRQCAICLVDFTAEEVKKIPLLVKRSIVPPLACIDDVFALIDKDAEYPSVFAAKYWRQLSEDKAWLQAARSRCPSLYMRVDDEKVRFEVLLREVGGGSSQSPVEGEYVLDKYRKGAMQQRDVLSPTVMYHAALARNTSVIVALCSKGVTTVKKPTHYAEQPLISFLLDDDERRRAERAAAPVAGRAAEDILADEESASEAILSILVALVEAGLSLEGTLSSGRRSILAELSERYGRCAKYKQLMKLWAAREQERSADPTQKYGLLRYVPSATTASPTRIR